MDNRPRYMISIAAELVGMHPQTLRIYENKGLVRPKRTRGNTRLYSESDLERLRLIQRLTTELGLNLAGVEVVLRLEDELRKAHMRIERLERRLHEEVSNVHKQYRRDLVVDVPVTFSEAALGATIDVPTPDGSVSLKVKPGTQDGTLLRVKGKGAPKLKGSGRGDVLARVDVTVPKRLKKRERELLEELQKVSGEDPREALFS